jgi:hypothetical protein
MSLVWLMPFEHDRAIYIRSRSREMLQPTLLPDVPVTLVVLPFSATAEAVIGRLLKHWIPTPVGPLPWTVFAFPILIEVRPLV